MAPKLKALMFLCCAFQAAAVDTREDSIPTGNATHKGKQRETLHRGETGATAATTPITATTSIVTTGKLNDVTTRVSLTVENVDYQKLKADEINAFKRKVRGTIAAVAGNGVKPDDVELKLSGGSVKVVATVQSNEDVAFEVREALSEPALRRKIVEEIENMIGIDRAVTGVIAISAVCVGEVETCPEGSADGSTDLASEDDEIPQKDPWHVQLKRQLLELKSFLLAQLRKTGKNIQDSGTKRPLATVYIIAITVIFSSLLAIILLVLLCKCKKPAKPAVTAVADAPRVQHTSETIQENLPDGATFKSFKWKIQLGSPRMFHLLWWFFFFVMGPLWLTSLLFVFNPHLQPCGPTISFNAELGQCFDHSCNRIVHTCLTHQGAQGNLGKWRAWVLDYAGLNYHALWFESSDCFRPSSTYDEVLFWLFFALECMGFFFTLLYSRLNWNCVARQNILLDEFQPDFAQTDWPTVDVILCHFDENSDATIRSLEQILAMRYNKTKMTVYIGDDGPMETKFNGVAGAYSNYVDHSGAAGSGGQFDVRAKVAALMDGKGCTRVQDIVEPGDNRMRRLDCAIGYLEDVYTEPTGAIAEVHYVARIKSKYCHAKAGNINNILYNTHYKDQDKPTKNKYVVILDNGKLPHETFLVSTLPEFFEFVPDAAGCQYTDTTDQTQLVHNNIAFVQTPRHLEPNALMRRFGDPLSHSNGLYFNSIMHGMDGYDSAMFVGTDAIWRRDALDSIHGIQYGTVSEGIWTSLVAHRKGWNSAYIRKDRAGNHTGESKRLVVGAVPDNVATSLNQRKQQHKGGVEIFLGMARWRNNMSKTEHAGEDWMKRMPPHILKTRRVPFHVKAFRTLEQMCASWSWLQVLNPFILTYLTCSGLISDRFWIYLNPLPTLLVMVPYYLLSSAVPTLGSLAASNKDMHTDTQEFFTYAWVTLVGTIEVLWEFITCSKRATRRNGAKAAGCKSELFTILMCFILGGCCLYSLEGCLLHGDVTDLAGILALWAFAWQQLYMYWRIAAPSLQEMLGFEPFPLKNAALIKVLQAPLILLAASFIKQKVENSLQPLYRCPDGLAYILPSGLLPK